MHVRDEAGGVLASYTYGATNERLISQEGDVRTYYAWSGSTVITEYTEVGTSTQPVWSKHYVYLGGRLLATIQPSGGGSERVEFHHPDRLGTRLVTNNQDQSYYEQATLPYGIALDAESTGATNRRFTSYDRSSVTGLDYAVNRHYDPQQGRFTQVDPIGMKSVDLTDPQTLNLYAYVRNDPVNFADPTGMLTVGPVNGGQLGVVTVRADAGPDWTALWELWLFGMQMNQRLMQPLVDGLPELPVITPPQNPVEVNKLGEPPIDCNQKLLVSLDSDLQVSYGQNARPYFAPDFARAFSAAVRELNIAGIRPRINSAFRTIADQQRMRAGGAGRNPAASLSLHQAGYAVDINGTATQEFQTIRQVMESHGFTWGGRFRHRDPPHFEINPFGTKGTEE